MMIKIYFPLTTQFCQWEIRSVKNWVDAKKRTNTMQENVTEAKQRPADHHGDGNDDAVDDDDDVVTGDDYN